MTTVKLKTFIERILSRGVIGWAVSRASGDWIRTPSVPRGIRSVLVNAPRAVVSDNTRASLFWGFYEAQEIRYIDCHLSPRHDVVELGASIGVVSAHIARKLGGRHKLFCIEANPRLESLINQTVLRNVPSASVAVVNAAVDYSGSPSVAFAIEPDVIASHLARRGETGTVVSAITLDTLLTRFSIGDYTLVCDIEGAEASMLLHDARAFANCRAIIIELHDTATFSIADQEDRLNAIGFRCIERRGPVLVLRREDSV